MSINHTHHVHERVCACVLRCLFVYVQVRGEVIGRSRERERERERERDVAHLRCYKVRVDDLGPRSLRVDVETTVRESIVRQKIRACLCVGGISIAQTRCVVVI